MELSSHIYNAVLTSNKRKQDIFKSHSG